MRSVRDHQEAIHGLFGPPEAVEVAVTDALGLVTAVDVVTGVSLPGFDNSAMDGYAVLGADLAEASTEHPVTLPMAADIPAGRTDRLTLTPGTVARIMTGAPLPGGADAVVPVEQTASGPVRGRFAPVDQGPQQIRFTAPIPVGKNIRVAGSDIVAGEVAIRAGTELHAPQLGLLAAIGAGTVRVWRRPRVVVLSTGSELVAPGHRLRHGQIYESNSPMLAAAATEAGALARTVHFVPDDVDGFLTRIAEIAGEADLIVTSGGVSAGAFEVVKDALIATGGVEFAKVAMQPGMPQGCGHVTDPSGQAVPIITLPGNPVSSLVSFEVFIRPPLRTKMGLPPHRARVTARLRGSVGSPAGKRQFLRGVLERDGDGWVVDPIGPPSSHHLRYLAGANALIDVATDITALADGVDVEVLVLD
ncbi:molybdopterin molybdenumtransferase MoeA [Gordonia pseudamarae]|uniref:Molybdopterin molybdenumtransferase n=1 Tax=Gordonia pseudamarae TaxID=2831662 RepID=A0ABX6INH6_9ACTN|nr:MULTISPECIES: gephyrin-like molybdotransferase Glp [Gordonia]MBD0022071.1 molybdopterin molybdotransferase MoeA [Gordonia sp. (in: high G+C Gram-positive bacteria)]QHN28410.1 molybdopterin molybdenumtransferase MoeA [Gordonia pseudamarae]QHN37276.1 molybdopterin molybdenumtransferase MoeA [Gordonia pseudamarae]